MYEKVWPKERLASARIPENSTGKKAEQGNSTTVITKEKRATTLSKIAKFFLLAKIFSILGLSLPSRLEEEQFGPCLYDFINSLNK